MSTTAKDLTKEAPRSPRERIGAYPLLARAIDKGRAQLAGTVGEYHFDCPLDNYLFGFKGVKGEDLKTLLAEGGTDEDALAWLEKNGEQKSLEEIAEWSAGLEAYRPYDDPDKKDWFVGECEAVGIDPKTSTLFDFLETDDRKSFE